MDNNLEHLDPTGRFSNRVKDYIKYRPAYPGVFISFFEQELGLKKGMLMVDIGSGTGLFSEPFLKEGYRVVCIEPNEEMRKAGEDELSKYPGFISSSHRGEDTGLASASVDFIIVAQAFHWMGAVAAKKEFLRILKPNGHIVICWILALQSTPFLKEYEEIRKKYGIDYKAVKRADESSLELLYAPMKMNTRKYKHSRLLDFESLKGQLLSASFIPLPGHTAYQPMMDALTQLFNTFNKEGYVEMEYETIVFWNG